MADSNPITSEELARRTSTSERYANIQCKIQFLKNKL